jgi:hypothetical protein
VTTTEAAEVMELAEQQFRATQLVDDLRNEGLITLRGGTLLLGDLAQ